MASEVEANRARELLFAKLRKLGAHAIGVEETKIRGQPTFAVVAYVKHRKNKRMPKALTYAERDKSIDVPLVVRESEPFKPE